MPTVLYSLVSFSRTPKPVTLNDHERPFYSKFSFRPAWEIVAFEDNWVQTFDPYWVGANVQHSAGTSGNIRFMRIFTITGFSGDEASNETVGGSKRLVIKPGHTHMTSLVTHRHPQTSHAARQIYPASWSSRRLGVAVAGGSTSSPSKGLTGSKLCAISTICQVISAEKCQT